MSNLYLDSCISFPLSDNDLNDVVEKAKDWAIMHGAGLRSKTNYFQFHPAPFILNPTTFPRKEFEKAVELQTTLNELTHLVAHDSEFLCETLAATIKVDEFTSKLFQIYEKMLAENDCQLLSLGLLRSDIMLDSISVGSCSMQSFFSWKQVEINTIASGFGHLGPISKEIQSYVLRELGHDDKLINLPTNSALSGLCDAMVEAWKMQSNPEAVILFIIEDISYNIFDQRFHEFYIRENHPKVKVVRKTLTEIHQFGKLGPNKELIVNDKIASVVYFRAGYDPVHYHSQNEWDARLLIERSQAIKCPSIQYHLAGTKKVQQALAKPGILNRFLKDTAKVAAVSEIFTGLYSLDDNEEGRLAVEMALKNPDRYVLKPQREGGGNNIYGKDIADALNKMSPSERSGFILMERIFPPKSKGYLIRPEDEAIPPLVDLVSELGIFGAIIGDKTQIMYNKQCGHMLRTKLSSANEGGVAAGFAALDSPYLSDH